MHRIVSFTTPHTTSCLHLKMMFAQLRRFYPDMEWYVDTMITLIERGGEFVTRDVWHATVQLVRLRTLLFNTHSA